MVAVALKDFFKKISKVFIPPKAGTLPFFKLCIKFNLDTDYNSITKGNSHLTGRLIEVIT